MGKDWTGGSSSIWKSLGASNHTSADREENDYYATDPEALKKFLKQLSQDGYSLNSNIWECASGAGHLTNVLKDLGYTVYSTDIVDRGCCDVIFDFLQATKESGFYLEDESCPYTILTNPPYKYAEEFVRKALEILPEGSQAIFFLKIQFLEGKERYKLFKENPPKYVYVHSSRVPCAKNGQFNSEGKGKAVCYAWYIWEIGYKGETVIRWIK